MNKRREAFKTTARPGGYEGREESSMSDDQKYFDYLEKLRESGEVNMFGAVPHLQRQFPELGFDGKRAGMVLQTWMDSYKDG